MGGEDRESLLLVGNLRDVELVVTNGKNVIVNLIKDRVGENSVGQDGIAESIAVMEITYLSSAGVHYAQGIRG